MVEDINVNLTTTTPPPIDLASKLKAFGEGMSGLGKGLTCLGCLGLIILAVIAAVAGNSTSSPSDNNSGQEQTNGSQPGSGGGEEEIAATWHKVKSWSGTSDKKTETFEIKGEQWRITWTNKDTSGFNANILYIYVYEPGSDFPAETISAQGSGDTSYVYEKGTFYLDISVANAKWTATVEDYH
ncbi:MAG: hypothetical protein WED08_01560 [Patescibacteria group bacterium]